MIFLISKTYTAAKNTPGAVAALVTGTSPKHKMELAGGQKSPRPLPLCGCASSSPTRRWGQSTALGHPGPSASCGLLQHENTIFEIFPVPLGFLKSQAAGRWRSAGRGVAELRPSPRPHLRGIHGDTSVCPGGRRWWDRTTFSTWCFPRGGWLGQGTAVAATFLGRECACQGWRRTCLESAGARRACSFPASALM